MKEEEFLRFQGPAWKGEGHELGVSVVKKTIWSGTGNELGDECKQTISKEGRRVRECRQIIYLDSQVIY